MKEKIKLWLWLSGNIIKNSNHQHSLRKLKTTLLRMYAAHNFFDYHANQHGFWLRNASD